MFYISSKLNTNSFLAFLVYFIQKLLVLVPTFNLLLIVYLVYSLFCHIFELLKHAAVIAAIAIIYIVGVIEEKIEVLLFLLSHRWEK